MLDAVKNNRGCTVLWGGGKDKAAQYRKQRGQIQLLVRYECGFTLEMPWKFPVVQVVRSCLWGSADVC